VKLYVAFSIYVTVIARLYIVTDRMHKRGLSNIQPAGQNPARQSFPSGPRNLYEAYSVQRQWQWQWFYCIL